MYAWTKITKKSKCQDQEQKTYNSAIFTVINKFDQQYKKQNLRKKIETIKQRRWTKLIIRYTCWIVLGVALVLW